MQKCLLWLTKRFLKWLLRHVLIDLVGNPEIVGIALVVLADRARMRL